MEGGSLVGVGVAVYVEVGVDVPVGGRGVSVGTGVVGVAEGGEAGSWVALDSGASMLTVGVPALHPLISISGTRMKIKTAACFLLVDFNSFSLEQDSGNYNRRIPKVIPFIADIYH